jgi:hypothetical protein
MNMDTGKKYYLMCGLVIIFSLHLSAHDNRSAMDYHSGFHQGYLITEDTPAPPPPPAWSYGGRSAISFSQMSLVNWSAGGENAYSLAGIIQLFNKYDKGKANWANTLDLGYGVIRSAELGVRKSDDKIDFLSKFGYQAINRWYYSGMVNFKTQMDKGYLYEKNTDPKMISRLMAPGYLLGSLGMEYKSKADNFYILISPFTGKSTFVLDDSLSNAGAYGVTPGNKFRMEFGGYSKIAYSKEIAKNVNLSTKLDLFSNYLETPQNIDINLETIFMMKVNKFLVTTLSINMIYDDDIKITDSKGNTGPRTQFKEVLAIGFSYSF